MAIPTKEKLEEIAVFAKAHSSYFGTVQQEMVHTVAYLKVMGNTEVSSSGVSFLKVKVGPYVGYISKGYLRGKKPECFADEFPRFFDNLNLSLTDMYYWGKLYDQYITGRSRVK